MSLTKARELRQDRAKLHDSIQADIVEAEEQRGGLSAEEEQSIQKRLDEVDALQAQIDSIEARERRMAEHSERIARDQERLDDHREFGGRRESAEAQDVDQDRAFRRYVLGEMSAREYTDLNNEIRRSKGEVEWRTIQGQTKGTAAQGGNTVPTDFLPEVQVHLKAYGGVRSVARVIRTSNGQNLPIPTSDDTGNVAKIVGEAVAPSTTTRVPFGQVTMEAVAYQSGPIKLSWELLQDSAIDIRGFVAEAMGTRFGRVTNLHYTTRSSTESSGPHGFVADSSGAVAVANNTLTYDDMIDLLHSVDPAYRTPDAAFMTNDAGFAEVRKLRDSTGAGAGLVWQPSLVPGQPDTILGYRTVLNQDVPLEGTSGNKWLWFGNWMKGYAIRDVADMSMRVLEERYAEEGNIALLGWMRTDGRTILPSTTAARRPYRCIIQSTG